MCINTYTQNLEKWYWWTCLQGEGGDADGEIGLVDSVGGGEGETNGKSSVDIYTLSSVK